MRTIYLIQHDKIPEYTKIGFTDNLKQRVNTLNTASPTGIKVIFSRETPYAFKIEQSLHARYSSYNTNLEWFSLSEEQIRDIIDWINNQLDRYENRKKK